MGLRKSFLKPFEKVKQKLTEGRHEGDGRPRGENDQEGEAHVGGSEASRRNPRLHFEVEDVMEIGPSREGNGVAEEVDQVNPSIPTLSIPRSEVSGSM